MLLLFSKTIIIISEKLKNIMLAIFVAVGAVAAMSYASVNRTRDFTKGEQDASSTRQRIEKDDKEIGMNWDQQRVTDLHLTNLNAAFMPYTAPKQDPTDDYGDIAYDDADRSTYVSTYNPPFFFRNNNEIPYTSAQSARFNIELPSSQSIRGDTDASLARNPRVYIDQAVAVFANDKGTTGANGASEAEVWDEEKVPETGQLNFFMYPFSMGGAIQQLFNNKNEEITKKRGTNQATMIGPPIFSGSENGLFNNKY